MSPFQTNLFKVLTFCSYDYTLIGVGTFLKEKNPNIKAILADPQGSVLYNYFKHGKLERSEGSSITEGIGQGRVTNNLKGAPIDDALCILDSDAVNMVSCDTELQNVRWFVDLRGHITIPYIYITRGMILPFYWLILHSCGSR